MAIIKRMIALVFLLFSCSYALNNGLARTPPMGWNSWNHFGCQTSQITQELFKEMAQAMVSSGMKAVGYEYINMDDCWLAATRDSNGMLQPDPTRFPDGIKALSDYIHSLGLKFGIYEDTGIKTCGGFPGSGGHYPVDVKTYAAWGVDYVKLDGCYTNVTDMQQIYTEYSQLLNQTGRPMVFSCSWPAYAVFNNQPVPWNYVASICNLWREYDDIRDNWYEWTNILDFQEKTNLQLYAGPGHWNDPDMLEVGNGNQTEIEYRSHFSLWAMLAAPLIAGNDLRNMSYDTVQILTAPEVIAVDQDPLGEQGMRVVQNGLEEVWARNLADGSIAVALFNRSPSSTAITANWADIGLGDDVTANVRDLWQRSDLGQYTGSFTSKVLPHGTVLVKVTKASRE